MDALSVGAKQLAGGDQDRQSGRPTEQILDEASGMVHQVFAAIEHDQDTLPLDGGSDRVDRI